MARLKYTAGWGKDRPLRFGFPAVLRLFEDTQTKRAQAHPNGKPLAGKRILLAEDNDLNAEIAIALLEEEGLLVERAADGVKCMEMLEKHRRIFYDLILMDIQMPILGGYDTTRKNPQNGGCRKGSYSDYRHDGKCLCGGQTACAGGRHE